MLHAVVDPGVFVSGLLSRDGPPARLLRLWADEAAFELIVSPGLIAELEEVLRRPRLAERISPDEARGLVEGLRADAVLVDDPPDPVPTAADPDDDYLVALVAVSRADVLVSGDRHLTELAPRVRVVTPREFLDLLVT